MFRVSGLEFRVRGLGLRVQLFVCMDATLLAHMYIYVYIPLHTHTLNSGAWDKRIEKIPVVRIPRCEICAAVIHESLDGIRLVLTEKNRAQ